MMKLCAIFVEIHMHIIYPPQPKQHRWFTEKKSQYVGGAVYKILLFLLDKCLDGKYKIHECWDK